MLIWIYGDDGFRVKERGADMRTKFAEKFDPTGMNTVDIAVRVADDVDRGAIMQSVQSAPFLSEKRFVMIRGLGGVLKKAEAQAWAEDFLKTPESTIVVFLETAETAKVEKMELFKLLTASPAVHKYPLPLMQGGELRAWAAERAKVYGATFAPRVLEGFLERTGPDTWRIDGELSKLAAYATGSPITTEIVSLLVRHSHEEDVFGLIDAIVRGDARPALRRLAEERLAGTEEFPLFGMLVRQVRILLQVKDYLDRNLAGTKASIATELGLHPFVAQKSMGEVKRYSLPQLQALHDQVFRFDRAMKRGLAADVAVDAVVTGLLAPQRT